ncbi:MAG: hypothetical protein F6J93_06850 [Oscillatoria sp. SIO1A7]|nr:hypothetical protein [Oscillatoria sp. SIO1A7]
MPNNTWSRQLAKIAREDMVMFVNACFACTGQQEFYSDAWGGGVSIDFLHDYILGNYRLLYARTLAAGINHFNQAQIILKLLATGKETLPEHRAEEGALIAATLNRMPPQRAWRLLVEMRQRRINNRRSRAIARDYIKQREDMSFHAVKYRSKVRAIAIHNHLNLAGELGLFLFRHWQQRAYETELFEVFRKARYDREAVYRLPLTVAEGFAAKHDIPRDVFLYRIQPMMTKIEKLRFQESAKRAGDIEVKVDLGRMPLTRLALYVLSLALGDRQKRRDILHSALERSAQNCLKVSPFQQLERVAAVLDCSYSASGSSEKRRRPLGVALAGHYLLQAASKEYRAFWTLPVEDPILVRARGQTNIAEPLLDALDWNPDLIVIISDACDNDPPRGAAEVLRIYRDKLDPKIRTSIIHCNPVFDAEDFYLRQLSPAIPTVGLRDAEDLPTMLSFARFAEGSAPLSQLEAYLAFRVKEMLN